MDLYDSLSFKTNEQIELMTGTKLTTIQYASLKGHITSHIGHQKIYDGIVKETLPQKKHTFSNIKDFIINNKKGSGTIKKIINRKNKKSTYATQQDGKTNWTMKMSPNFKSKNA